MFCVRNIVMQVRRSNILAARFSSQSPSMQAKVEDVMKSQDEIQVQLMQERCILVNEQDQAIGSASKKKCHLLENINDGMLHRAFSVFLFNERDELLLQQRSDAKITFPGMFTNTCCSHPLDTVLEKEDEGGIGVKRAAQRKLFHELGITPDQVPLTLFHYITRIKYQAENIPRDNVFGEHEIDYVLFVKRNVSVCSNVNEVKSYRYVNQAELRKILGDADSGEIKITPWFKLICETFLFDWWPSIDKVESIQDHETIHVFS